MMSFSSFEFRASRCSDDHALLTSVNNSLPHFRIIFFPDLDKLYAVSLSSCDFHENRRRERLTSPLRVERILSTFLSDSRQTWYRQCLQN
jgi:hypothetical protein